MNSQIRLSIIIPVYNLEGYVEDTIESCLKQDIPVSEYEIICVNDGSKDQSLKVLQRVASKHTNIRIFDKPNGGVSQARNYGLSKASGKYVWFVDGDDLITENCIGSLLSMAEGENTDILWFKMRPFTKLPTYELISKNCEVCDDRNKLYAFMFSIGGGGVCVNFYKTELLRNSKCQFSERIKYSEDVLFHFSVLLNASKCAKTDLLAYHYRQRPGSAMHSNNSDLHAESMHLLTFEYDKLLTTEHDADWRKLIIDNRDRAVRALIFSLVISGKVEKLRSILSEFSDLGFYPYHLRVQSLYRNKTYKQFLINLMSFLFPWRPYAMFTAKCFATLKIRK